MNATIEFALAICKATPLKLSMYTWLHRLNSVVYLRRYWQIIAVNRSFDPWSSLTHYYLIEITCFEVHVVCILILC